MKHLSMTKSILDGGGSLTVVVVVVVILLMSKKMDRYLQHQH